MADNRIYVICRWCERQQMHPRSFGIAKFSWSIEEGVWYTNKSQQDWDQFLSAHMHKDEPEWWSEKYVMCPVRFEYETDESNSILSEPIKDRIDT